jgi:hypothetical protein
MTAKITELPKYSLLSKSIKIFQIQNKFSLQTRQKNYENHFSDYFKSTYRVELCLDIEESQNSKKISLMADLNDNTAIVENVGDYGELEGLAEES